MKRVLGAAASALLVVSACGSSEPDVISLTAAASRSEISADVAGGNSSMSKVAPWITYALADGLDRPADTAYAWTTSVPNDAASRLEGLARAFAITGAPVASPDGSVTIGSDRKVSSWSWGGVVSWAYDSGMMSGASRGVVSPACLPSAAPCNDTIEITGVDTPPTDLISTGDALVKARRILGAAGYGVDQTALDAGSSEWSTWVDVEILTEGVRSGLTGRIDFGSGGVVTSAYGQFVSLERADDYPLADLRTALDRLAVPLFASSSVTRGTAGDSADTTGAAPKPVTVTITGVDLVLQQITVADDESLLVPSYRFSSADGVVAVVFAVHDKYLDTDPAGATPGTGAPEPAPAPGTSEPIAQSDADTLVGLAEDDAVKTAEGRGWTVRIAERDGEQFMLTLDFQTNRVNLSITKGRVTAVTVG